MTIKQMDCVYYYPGDITYLDKTVLSGLMKRFHKGDNQRRTEFYYIYAGSNLLGGK